MNEVELLKAIETMMDKKLDEKLEPIKADIAGLKTDMVNLKSEIADLKEYAEETRNGVNYVAEWVENIVDAAPKAKATRHH